MNATMLRAGVDQSALSPSSVCRSRSGSGSRSWPRYGSSY